VKILATLFGIVLLLWVIARLVTPPDTSWEYSGEIELTASPEIVWPWLAELERWPDWLMWREHPFPDWQLTDNAGYPAALITQGDSTQARVTRVQLSANSTVAVSMNRPDEKIAGQCLFQLFKTRHGSDLEWHCNGRYNVSLVNETWLQFGITPQWPFDIPASMRRLQLRFE